MNKIGFMRESFWDYIKPIGINRSSLFELLDKSPAHMKAKEEDNEITEALLKGDAFHAAVLEPTRFEKEYTVLPANCRPGSGKGMKERKDTFVEKNKDLTILTQKIHDDVRAMAAGVHAHPDLQDLLSHGESETSAYYWDDTDEKGLLLKSRLDWINQERHIIVDLKSAADARFHLFKASAYNHGYHLQCGMSCLGVSQITQTMHEDFRFIVVESKPPYGIMIHPAGEEMINYGIQEMYNALDIYKRCLKDDIWPCYESTGEVLGLPKWKQQNKVFD